MEKFIGESAEIRVIVDIDSDLYILGLVTEIRKGFVKIEISHVDEGLEEYYLIGDAITLLHEEEIDRDYDLNVWTGEIIIQ